MMPQSDGLNHQQRLNHKKMVEDMTGKEIKSKQYIADDRTGEINQIGPFEAENIYDAVEMLLDGDFENFRNNIDMEIVDDKHGYIVINLPGGARYEYEVGELVDYEDVGD